MPTRRGAAADPLGEYLCNIGNKQYTHIAIFLVSDVLPSSQQSLPLSFAALDLSPMSDIESEDEVENGSDEQREIKEQKRAHQKAEKAQQEQNLIIKDQGK